MQVILLERIGRLGQMGDVVNVKDGFARNFLLPQGKALRATEANRKRFERERAQLEARDLVLKSEAQGVSGKLDGKSFIVIRQAGDTGQLYGSVSTRDIATAITEGGFSVERRQVLLDRPIKTLGVHDVRVALHAEVVPHVSINVARSADTTPPTGVTATTSSFGSNNATVSASASSIPGSQSMMTFRAIIPKMGLCVA